MYTPSYRREDSSIKLQTVKLLGGRAELVTNVLFLFFRPRPNEQSLPSAIGLSHLTVPPRKHQVS